MKKMKMKEYKNTTQGLLTGAIGSPPPDQQSTRLCVKGSVISVAVAVCNYKRRSLVCFYLFPVENMYLTSSEHLMTFKLVL